MKAEVEGTRGYSPHVDRYADVTEDVPFTVLHRVFLPFMPTQQSRVLDVGAGTGRDAAAFAAMGHDVTAVEPCDAFRSAASRRYTDSGVRWLDDALPTLAELDGRYDFVLASSVWHHLRVFEQEAAIWRVAELLAPGGVIAVSLRSGPAGIGQHVFPTSSEATREHAESAGLTTLVHQDDEPSLLPGRPLVRWARLAFRASTGTRPAIPEPSA